MTVGSDPFATTPDYEAPEQPKQPTQLDTIATSLAGRPRKGETPALARLRRLMEQSAAKRRKGSKAPPAPEPPSAPSGAAAEPPGAASGAEPPPVNAGGEAGKPSRADIKAAQDLRKALAKAIVIGSDGVIGEIAHRQLGVAAEEIRATESERDQLTVAWDAYLATKEVDVSPGIVLLVMTLGVYGPKLQAAKGKRS